MIKAETMVFSTLWCSRCNNNSIFLLSLDTIEHPRPWKSNNKMVETRKGQKTSKEIIINPAGVACTLRILPYICIMLKITSIFLS